MAIRRIAGGVLLALVAIPAYANNPPAPPMFLGELLILPIMMLITALGGGYAILRRLHGPSVGKRIGLGIAAGVIILLSGTQEGYGFLVLIILSMIAIGRVIQLLVWSSRARRSDRPPYLAEANPTRLAWAGGGLLAVAIFVGGLAPAFIFYWSPSPERRVAALRKFVALQMAMQTPRAAELAEEREDDESRLTAIMKRPIIHRGPAGRFTIFLLPGVQRFPFFPYNYLVSEPSYRADESGAIRMVYVHQKDDICPPDAPIVLRVSSADVEEVLQGKVMP